MTFAVERATGSAAAFHTRPLPDAPVPAVWVHEVDRPALVLGSSQSSDVVDLDAAARGGVEVVTRRSGGGAVLLVPGEVLWLDVILPASDPRWVDDIGRSFDWLGRAWAQAVGGATDVHTGPMVRTRWSPLVCFAGVGPGEVSTGGRKLVGISQRRTRAAARFQCAVHRRFDGAAVAALLRLEPAEQAVLAAELDVSVAVVERPLADVLTTLLAAL